MVIPPQMGPEMRPVTQSNLAGFCPKDLRGLRPGSALCFHGAHELKVIFAWVGEKSQKKNIS